MSPQVTIYSTPTCHFCHQTKEFLNEHSIPFTDYDVSTDLAKRQEMIKKSGQMGVPVIIVGDTMMIGFNRAKLAKLVGVEE